MNNIFFTLFLFLLQQFYSQSYQATYDFDYKRDSTSNNYFTVSMILDIEKDHSKFYFQKLLKIDSLIRKGKRMSFFSPIQQIVKRKTNTFDYENFVNVADLYYSFASTDKINWKISDSIKNFNNYKLQKAEANWAGRQWIAWFCLDIPTSEGPYKFKGLPGLVMILKDTKNNFKYTLTSFKASNLKYNTQNIVETNLGNVPIKINLTQYQKLLLNEYENPFSEYENMKGTDWQLTIYDRKINTIEGLKEIKKQYQNDIKKNYNPIELDKAVKYP
ncbi:GLPGLI family protein [Chryseobacterium gossypii]|uniref:GLPGLI family protein n=1 Tax=Chryseobacterium gossypii TaxID=3231602 RepID=UPI003524CE5B